ncbi:M13 family metallopeptidase [Coralloluteibacterium stylophorae]|uniref:M13 family metallopeptidase n=1 Tax=Coralloluteibacterium stylophorae TaxID=1776034 RepID=UPI0030843AA1
MKPNASFRLLPLTLAVALSLGACGGDEPAQTASTDGTPAADTAPPSAVDAVREFQPTTPSAALAAGDVDPAIAACSDLNGYVNAKWLAANPVPADRTTWGSFELLGDRSLEIQHELVKATAAAEPEAGSIEAKIGDIWATGMDQAAIDAAGIAPLQPELDRIAALGDSDAVVAYLREAYARGEGGPFSFGANADYKNSEQVIAYAGQGGMGLPEKGYYVDEDKADIREAYVAYIARLLELSSTSAEQAQRDAQAVMDFETRLANASLSRIELRDPARRYNPVSLADADARTPHFAWPAFFEGIGVDAPEMFSMGQPEFFAELDAMLADESIETWKAYLRFHALDDAAPYLGSGFEQAAFEFHDKTLRGQEEMQPRWKRVLETVNGSMGMALGELYVQVAFPPESKAQMETLVGNLSEALKARLENLDWMSEETKARALEKWASFTPKIGYPDKWREWDGLETTRDSYLANVQAARAFNYRYMLDKIGQPVDKDEWHMTPQTVNAYYNPTRNEIVFPAAILQPPFFDPDADLASNYGGIGAVIGHEMMHGYDDSGSQFDAQGNFNSWWTDADRAEFEKRADALVAQFDEYRSVDDIAVKGRLTLGENIGDLGGLTIAYDALQNALEENPDARREVDGHTPEQRFFMNWATVWRRNFKDDELKVRLNTDPHAPANFRAVGAPSNLPAFAEAFECKPGDPMVRAERVVIW